MIRKIRFCDTASIPEGAYLCSEGVIVINVEGELFGYINRCPHRKKPFDAVKSDLHEGRVLVCGLHRYAYDCSTGQQLKMPDRQQETTLPLQPVRVERRGAEVWVEVEEEF